MSAMTIEYSRLNNFVSAAKKYSSRLEDRMDDYNGIKSKVSSIDTSRNNLSQSCYFIKKKNEKLGEKKEKIDRFRGRVETFIEDVKQADKRVAIRIKEDTNTFGKVEGINTSYAAHCLAEFAEWVKAKVKDVVGRIKQWAVDKVEEIKTFYERLKVAKKYIGAFLLDFGVLALEVGAWLATYGALISAATAGAAVFAAVGLLVGAFAIYNALSNMSYDAAAYDYYMSTGDLEGADELDSKGGRDAAEKHGLGYAWDVMNVVSTVYDIVDLGNNISDIHKLLRNGDLSFKPSRIADAFKDTSKKGKKYLGNVWSEIKVTGREFGEIINKTFSKNTHELFHQEKTIDLIYGCYNGKKTIDTLNVIGKHTGYTIDFMRPKSTARVIQTLGPGSVPKAKRLCIKQYNDMTFSTKFSPIGSAA